MVFFVYPLDERATWRDRSKPVLVLLDLSVVRHGILTQRAEINKTILWGDRVHTVTLEGWMRNPDLPLDQAWRQRQVECLPTIARLAREGRLTLCSYSELAFEEWRGKRGMRGTFGDLFADVPIRRIPPAVERSRFRQTIHLEQHLSKEALIEFCKFLLDLDPHSLRQANEFWQMLDDFDKANLVSLSRFKHLCRGLEANHYADAFHLWTGETNGLDFFLMIERKFPNAVRDKRDLGFHCRAVTPEELLQHIDVRDLDPDPFPDIGPRTFFD